MWSNLSRQSNKAVLVVLFTVCKWFLSKRINFSPRALSAFDIFRLGLVLVSAIRPSKGTPSALATDNAAVASGLLLGLDSHLLMAALVNPLARANCDWFIPRKSLAALTLWLKAITHYQLGRKDKFYRHYRMLSTIVDIVVKSLIVVYSSLNRRPHSMGLERQIPYQ